MFLRYICFALAVFFLSLPMMVQAAERDKANVGDMFRAVERGDVRLPSAGRKSVPLGDPSGIPGTEITPEDMAKAFPAPLNRAAPVMDLRPGPAPLLPLPPSGGGRGPQSPAIGTPVAPRDLAAPPVPPLRESGGKSLAAPPDSPSVSDQNSSGSARPQPQPPGNPSLEVMLGQMIMAGFTGTELQNNAPILEMIRGGRVGGLWLTPVPKNMGVKKENKNTEEVEGNILSPPQTRVLAATLQRAAGESAGAIPVFLAVEQEGGMVQALRRDLGFEGSAAAAKLGRGTVTATEVEGRRVGLEMAALGLNLNMAPAGDVNINPLSEDIGQRFRSFSPDPKVVAAHVGAFGKGLAVAGVIPCLRNFPGTGSVVRGLMPMGGSSWDALAPLPDMAGTWRSMELTPYAINFNQGWPGAVQPALAYHRGLDGLYPATLSRQLLTDILRQRLGFSGLVITRDLRELTRFYPLEEAVLLAVQAGADVLLISEPQQAIPQSRQAQAQRVLSQLGKEGGGGLGGDLVGALPGGLAGALGGALPGGVAGKLAGGMLKSAGEDSLRPKAGQATEAAKVYEILLRHAKEGRISMERVRQSWQRIMALKKNFLYTSSATQ